MKPKQKIAITMVIFCLTSSLLPVYSHACEELIPFIVRTASGPGKLDPIDAYDSVSLETIMQVCEGLYLYNYSSNEMEVIPCLASELGTWNPDVTELTISLKNDVKFHDGSHFNASAVKWCFDRIQYFTSGFWIDYTFVQYPLEVAPNDLFFINEVPILNTTEIIDEYHVRFILNFPCVIWEKLLAFTACAIHLPDPNYEYREKFFNQIDLNDPLIGTGPFMLSEYNFDDEVIFDYNADYHMEWGENHIEQMIYLIVPDDVTASLAVYNHEIHWGAVDDCYCEQFAADPALIEIHRKASVVYYMQMNLYNMKQEFRHASSFVWNHTYFLDRVLGGWHYELHVPVPDGMEYHLANFAGEPYHNYTIAREILLNSTDPEIMANITASGLNENSTREDWHVVAESTTPIAEFNYTRYESGLVYLCGELMQDYLKDIGIKLNILDAMPWFDWEENYLENPDGHKRLAYSFGGWGPDYNDPISMIEPEYGNYTGLRNCFGLHNTSWLQLLNETYSATHDTIPTREELFHTIQREFATVYVPSFYLLQLGGAISFNREYLDEDSVGDLLNVFSDLYWFNCRFTPPPNERDIVWEIIVPLVIAAGLSIIITWLVVSQKRKISSRKKFSS